MTIELIASIAAILLAGYCAVTDMLWGKIFNKAIVAGLLFATVWLTVYGLFYHFGKHTALHDYPELAIWYGEKMPAPKTIDSNILFGAHLEGKKEQSIMPGPGEEWPDEKTEEVEEIAPTPSYWAYLVRVLGNFLLSFVIGFVLWWFGMWAAGDAKLFPVLALMIPLGAYTNAFWPFFPSYVLLFNTFLAVMAILATELVIRFIRQLIRPTAEEAQAWKTTWEWVKTNVPTMIIGFIGIVFLFLIIKTLRMLTRDLLAAYTHITDSPLVYLLLFFVFFPLAKAMRRPWIGIPIAVITVGFIVWVAFNPTPEYNLEVILQVGALMLVLVGFYMVYNLYLNVFDFHPVKIWDLKPKMVLARKTMETLKEDQDLLKTKLGPVGPDGLAAEQVEILRRWWIDRNKGPHLWVSRTIPFGPALFIGTLATVILGGYIFRTY